MTADERTRCIGRRVHRSRQISQYCRLNGKFIYARLQRGKDTVRTAYPPNEIKAWAGRLRQMAEGKEPADLPRVAAPTERKPAPREVFAYVIHEGKIRAPAGAMALIEAVAE
jgi:uncharacterized protein YecE (DUF72 family)